MKDLAFWASAIAVGTVAADIIRSMVNVVIQRAAERRLIAMQRALAERHRPAAPTTAPAEPAGATRVV